MRYLIDTRTLLWSGLNQSPLSATARNLIVDPNNDIYVSIASFWELAIKSSIGKIRLPGGIKAIAALAEGQSIVIRPITLEFASLIETLPHYHRDPFDRIIAATALTEGIPLLSVDPIFDAYGISRNW